MKNYQFLITVILLIVGFLSLQNSNKNLVSNVNDTLLKKDTIYTEMINEYGDRVLKTSVTHYDDAQANLLSDLDERFNAVNKRLSANGYKLRQLESSTSFKAGAKDTIVAEKYYTEVHTTDTIDTRGELLSKNWMYEDETIKINSRFLDTTFLEQIYELTPTTYSVELVKQNQKGIKGLFKKPNTYAVISSSNPAYKISNPRTLVKNDDKIIFSVVGGFGTSISMDNGNLKLRPALSVTGGIPLVNIRK